MKNKNQIKKVVAIVVVIIMTCIIGMITWDYVMHYEKEVKIVKIENNIVTVIDKINETWEFETNTPKQFKVNEKLIIKMDTMGTDFNIYDDKIVDVKKINE